MAYASVASLMRTMESVLAPKSQIKSLVCDHREEFLAFQEKVSLLEVFLKNFEKSNNSGKMTDFEEQIKQVANAVERIIQMRLAESVMAKDEMHKEEARKRLCDSLKQVAEEIDRAQKEATKIQHKGKQALKESLVQDSSSREDIVKVKNKMVGRGYQRKSLLNDLTRDFSSEPKVIPIVGMGGIGKTTLANEVFHDASVQHHFDVRAWATVSSQHNVKVIYINLLHWTLGEAFDEEDEAELADMLQKSLKGKRYLIVLDDIWKSKAWDDVRLCFPSENNGSRILLTTRDSEVACDAGTENLSLQMGFMDPDESWNLFKSMVLENEALPSRFETIGKQVIDKCQGLPLTIVVVAGLLSKSKRIMEVWEHVAEDVKSIVTNDPDEQCLHVLGLSYNHLSSDLKACLLYFAIFPEDTEISVNKLMRLWIAEGFLKLEKDLEGEAEKCLKDLIDRCLVLVIKKNLDGTKVRSCKVHDLIYELCLREAERKNIFIMNDIVYDDEPSPIPPKCRHIMRPCKRSTDSDVTDHGSYKVLLTPRHHDLIRRKTDDDDDNILNRTRSILSFHRTSSPFTLEPELIHFNLLRILDLARMKIDFFPRQILCLIWLRYLVLCGDYDLPPEIGMLWNLHTFINVIGYKQREVTFPEQIWELMQLRQLRLHKFHLSNPPRESDDKESYLAFSNMHTISGLSPSSCTKEVISGIRNAKKLVITGHANDYEIFQESRLFNNLVHLHQLETLSLALARKWDSSENWLISPATIPSITAFPATLKKLKLSSTGLKWADLNIIGELPNLEVLKLMWDACTGDEWTPIAGGFTRLRLLRIRSNRLKYWKATDESFPVLEQLLIINCRKLENIPIEFADIYTLHQIVLQGKRKPGLEASAARIRREQEDMGNKLVHVRIIEQHSDPDSDETDDE